MCCRPQHAAAAAVQKKINPILHNYRPIKTKRRTRNNYTNTNKIIMPNSLIAATTTIKADFPKKENTFCYNSYETMSKQLLSIWWVLVSFIPAVERFRSKGADDANEVAHLGETKQNSSIKRQEISSELSNITWYMHSQCMLSINRYTWRLEYGGNHHVWNEEFRKIRGNERIWTVVASRIPWT